ncbi:DNA alkylation repair protein [candidate division KSB1 bacterium]
MINILKKSGKLENREGMARFGINVANAFGVSVTRIREIAKEIGKNHNLALTLWDTGYHEARMLACIIDEHTKVSEEQMEQWVLDFDSWDLCDQCCSNLFRKTPFAYQKIEEWTSREETFVRRAGFVLIATLAVHDKKAKDVQFIDFFPLIAEKATDDRNMVKKAVNWALRQIGKRNMDLNKIAVAHAKELLEMKNKTASWIANDALRELTNEKTLKRIRKKSQK